MKNSSDNRSIRSKWLVVLRWLVLTPMLVTSNFLFAQQFKRFENLPDDCSLVVSVENTDVFDRLLGPFVAGLLSNEELKELCISDDFSLDVNLDEIAASASELSAACSRCDELRICFRCKPEKTEFAFFVYGTDDEIELVTESFSKIKASLDSIVGIGELVEKIQEQIPLLESLCRAFSGFEYHESKVQGLAIISNSKSLLEDIANCSTKDGKGSFGKSRRFQRVYVCLQDESSDAIAYAVPSDFAESLGDDFSLEKFQSYGYEELLGAGVSLRFGQMGNAERPLIDANVYVPYTVPENELIKVFKTYRSIDKWPNFNRLAKNDQFELVYLKAYNRDWASFIEKRQELYSKADESEFYEKQIKFMIDKMGGRSKFLSAYNGNVFFFRLYNESENWFFPVSASEHAGEVKVRDYVDDMISRVNEGTELVASETQINGCKAWFLSDDDAVRQHEINFGKRVSEHGHAENIGTVLTDKTLWTIDKRVFRAFFEDGYNLERYETDNIFSGYVKCFDKEQVVQIELFWNRSFFPKIFQFKYGWLAHRYSQGDARKIAGGNEALLGDSVSDDWYRILSLVLNKSSQQIDRAALGFSLPESGLKWHFAVFGNK